MNWYFIFVGGPLELENFIIHLIDLIVDLLLYGEKLIFFLGKDLFFRIQ